ncbi:MAG: Shikimate dehydrogenase (NADP(+)) [Promethearchaeota archaeon]|nr:MAG: Shikimate dehydrogenase (NADP(+)) [Candidatus Lokiarchaeota archaeon]
MTFTGKTKTFCLIGHPVEHSMSPTMWNPALEDLGLDYVYIAYDVYPNQLERAVDGFRALGIRGINVTIPHKEEVIKFLDEIEPFAQKLGAINTIKNEGGYLKARNTDAEGAKKSLVDAGCDLSGKEVLLMGAGGAARAICFVLSMEVKRIVVVDIVEQKAIELANEVKEKMGAQIMGMRSNESIIKEKLQSADILINATPIGMYPKIDNTPIAKSMLHPDLFVFDAVYNPLETKLLREAAEIGCKTLGGLDMLVNQGVLAFEWWTGETPNSELMKDKIIEFLGKK